MSGSSHKVLESLISPLKTRIIVGSIIIDVVLWVKVRGVGCHVITMGSFGCWFPNKTSMMVVIISSHVLPSKSSTSVLNSLSNWNISNLIKVIVERSPWVVARIEELVVILMKRYPVLCLFEALLGKMLPILMADLGSLPIIEVTFIYSLGPQPCIPLFNRFLFYKSHLMIP
jgi:hypothetical protein